MDKQSTIKAAQVLADAAAVIRQVTTERDDALAKLASIEQQQEAEKVASVMREKGLGNEDQIREVIEKAASQGRMAVLKEAVDLAGPDMWKKTAQLSDDRRGTTGTGSDLENYLLS